MFFFEVNFINKLEMTPTDYLEKYCRVNDRRKAFYRRCFDKYKLKSEQGDYLDLKVCFLRLLLKHSFKN